MIPKIFCQQCNLMQKMQFRLLPRYWYYYITLLNIFAGLQIPPLFYKHCHLIETYTYENLSNYYTEHVRFHGTCVSECLRRLPARVLREHLSLGGVEVSAGGLEESPGLGPESHLIPVPGAAAFFRRSLNFCFPSL